jgi:MFS transporter, DHA2 family, multidrug resistance protein
MQSILGAILTAGYAAAVASTVASAPNKNLVTNSIQAELEKSFSSAADTAQRYPHYASQITAGAKAAFLQGDQNAYTAGIVAILLGSALVYFRFPKHGREQELLDEYHAQDAAGHAEPAPAAAQAH